MGKITKELIITLYSDLCTASGFSYAGIIDSDVSFDGNGVPYISGRRIKGCLRETATKLPLISEENVRKLFGDADSDGVHGIIIGNAFPKEYDAEAWSEIKKDENIKDYLNEENTLELYTSVRGQTRIDENGMAQKDSLRYTRVINQYDFSGAQQVFVTSITFDESLEQQLKQAIAGTRNIGLNRNRGLGSVCIRLGDKISDNKTIKIIDRTEDSGTGKVRIKYAVRNIEPLILSSEKNSDTANYISGSIILGALASKYLSKDNTSATDDFFKEVFLKKGAAFSDLTIATVCNNEYVPMQPAPMYINRLKKTGCIVNMSATNNQCSDEKSPYCQLDGNRPKKLTNYYISLENGTLTGMKEVAQEIIYHHSKNGRNKEDTEGVLYFMNVISTGQVFAGDIVVKKTFKKDLLKLITEKAWYLGKSRTAQYGKCEVIGDVVVEPFEENMKFNCSSGEKIIVTFVSDGIFWDEQGTQNANPEQIEKLVSNALLSKNVFVSSTHESFLKLKTIYGFQAKWNRRKNDMIAVAAGSAFIMNVDKDIAEYPRYIGEKNIEGFGHIIVTPQKTATYEVNVLETEPEINSDIISYPYMKEAYCRSLQKRIYAILRERAFEDVVNGTHKLKITSSSLGRLTLMLKEAINETNDTCSCLRALYERVESIKSVEKKEEIQRFLRNWFDENCIGEEKRFISNSIIRIEHFVQKDESMKEFLLLKDMMKETEAERRIFDMLPSCLLEVLTLVKYRSE